MKQFKVLSVVAVCTFLLSSVGVMAAESWKVTLSNQNFIVNGEPVKTNALNINDSNYVKAAELAELLDIDITFDETTNTVFFDKTKSFTGVKTIAQTTKDKQQEQIVKVDIKKLDAGQYEILDLVDIKTGDRIGIHIKSNAKGTLFVGFTKDNSGKKPETTYYGDGDMFGEKGIINKTITADSKEGKYYFYVSNVGQETMENITGEVKIVRAK